MTYLRLPFNYVCPPISFALAGSADNTCRIWDAETGVQMHQLDTSSAVRTCGFSYGGQLLFLTTDKAMMKNCEVQVRVRWKITFVLRTRCVKEAFYLLPWCITEKMAKNAVPKIFALIFVYLL